MMAKTRKAMRGLAEGDNRAREGAAWPRRPLRMAGMSLAVRTWFLMARRAKTSDFLQVFAQI